MLKLVEVELVHELPVDAPVVEVLVLVLESIGHCLHSYLWMVELV